VTEKYRNVSFHFQKISQLNDEILKMENLTSHRKLLIEARVAKYR
jgi:hypothetical protein